MMLLIVVFLIIVTADWRRSVSTARTEENGILATVTRSRQRLIAAAADLAG